MAAHDSMNAFNLHTEDWTIYAEWLEHYLVANSVEDAGKLWAILLYV